MNSPVKLGSYVVGRRLNEHEWLAHSVTVDSMCLATVRITEIAESDETGVSSQSTPESMDIRGIEVSRRLSRPRQLLGVQDDLEPNYDPSLLSLGDSHRVRDARNSSERKVSLVKRVLQFLQRFRKSTAFVAVVVCVAGISAMVFVPVSSTEHVATQARPTSIITQVAPTPTNSPSKPVTGEWFRTELAKKPGSQGALQVASQIEWSPDQELASRLISQSGDLSLYALCGIDTKAESRCVNVVIETDARGSHIREMIKPAA